MLKREFFAELKNRGYSVSATTLHAAIQRGHVTRPVKADDGWYDYSLQQVDEFCSYLKRTERRRRHLAAVLAERGRRVGRPKKNVQAS
jgi:hypothetical protein